MRVVRVCGAPGEVVVDLLVGFESFIVINLMLDVEHASQRDLIAWREGGLARLVSRITKLETHPGL